MTTKWLWFDPKLNANTLIRLKHFGYQHTTLNFTINFNMQTAKTSKLITGINFWSILNYNGKISIKESFFCLMALLLSKCFPQFQSTASKYIKIWNSIDLRVIVKIQEILDLSRFITEGSLCPIITTRKSNGVREAWSRAEGLQHRCS